MINDHAIKLTEESKHFIMRESGATLRGLNSLLDEDETYIIRIFRIHTGDLTWEAHKEEAFHKMYSIETWTTTPLRIKKR